MPLPCEGLPLVPDLTGEAGVLAAAFVFTPLPAGQTQTTLKKEKKRRPLSALIDHGHYISGLQRAVLFHPDTLLCYLHKQLAEKAAAYRLEGE